ncbi:MAG TPA: adenosylcobinamide-GDP ribazoletransferase [Anaerolineales bacterium]|nr:adenosylcobinamide-GDP ribazoletransferase [Anaerolineales bacterium]
MLDRLILALSFLTRLPTPALARTPVAGDLGRSAAWFPLVGLILGGLLAGALYGLRLIFEPWLAATLVVALWAALTGGLHLDGLADCGDALLPALTRERRLQILTDPRLGTFGVLTLSLLILLKIATVAALPEAGLVPLAIAPVIGRWLAVIAGKLPLAKNAGLGEDFAAGLTPAVIAFAALLPIGVLALGVLGDLRVLVALLVAHLAALAGAAISRERLGGMGGDMLGAIIEVSELVILLTFAARWPA